MTQPAAETASPFDDGELYDVLFHNFNFGTDFYVKLAREAKGPVLEIACGTGRIMLPCLQAGADVDGLDYFAPMLETLRKKAEVLGFKPTLHESDMSDFQLPRKYALITITFNAFINNVTQEAQIRCLERCREHLLPGGKLVFDIFFPGLHIVGAEENTRVLEAELPHPHSGLPMRMYDTRTFDRVKQTQHSINELEFLDAAGNIETVHRSEVTMRYVYKEEMALLLRVAGFTSWEIYGDFDGTPLTQENQMMIVVAHKA